VPLPGLGTGDTDQEAHTWTGDHGLGAEQLAVVGTLPDRVQPDADARVDLPQGIPPTSAGFRVAPSR
jgi:hypothetical protein